LEKPLAAEGAKQRSNSIQVETDSYTDLREAG
jgi:hypothetical protein